MEMKSYEETMKDLAKDKLEIWKKICVAKDVDGAPMWKCDYRYCNSQNDLEQYARDLAKESTYYGYVLEDEAKGDDSLLDIEWQGEGYYDYDFGSLMLQLVADGCSIYTDEIVKEIELMDRPVKIIGERYITPQIKTYVEKYVGLQRYEYNLTFKRIDKKDIDAIDRLDSCLRDLRKHSFIFHKEHKQQYFRETIENFNIIVYVEEDNKKAIDKIIEHYKLEMEDYIETARTM